MTSKHSKRILKRSRYFRFFAGWGKHILYQTKNGSLWACGLNKEGQCSVGHLKNVLKPEKVSLKLNRTSRLRKESWESVALGSDFSVFVTHKGKVYGCGSTRPSFSRFGTWLLDEESESSDEAQFRKGNYGSGPSSVTCWKKAREFPNCVSASNRITACFANESRYLLLASNGSVFASSTNLAADQRMLDGLSNIVDIATGDGWNLFFEKGGKIYGTGANGCGPLAIQANFCEYPTEVTYFKDMGIKIDYAETCQWTTYFVIADKNLVYTSGHSGLGEFGNGNMNSRNKVPVLNTPLSSFDILCTGKCDKFFVFKKDGKVYGTGQGWNFGMRQRIVEKATEIKGGFSDKKVVQLVTGNSSTYIICRDGSIYAGGDGSCGQLMIGRETRSQRSFEFVGKFDLRRSECFMDEDEKIERLKFLLGKYSILEILWNC